MRSLTHFEEDGGLACSAAYDGWNKKPSDLENMFPSYNEAIWPAEAPLRYLPNTWIWCLTPGSYLVLTHQDDKVKTVQSRRRWESSAWWGCGLTSWSPCCRCMMCYKIRSLPGCFTFENWTGVMSRLTSFDDDKQTVFLAEPRWEMNLRLLFLWWTWKKKTFNFC